MKIDVDMPKKVVVETDLLADLIGANKVYGLFLSGVIEAGQKNYEWHKRREDSTSEPDDTPLTEDEENELSSIASDLDRGLET